MIDVEAISFAFGTDQVLSDVSFTVKTGEIVGVLGQSGVGKTTLLRCISGLLQPQQGEIKIDEMGPADAAKHQKIGYLFQQDSLLEWRTVAENVSLPFEAGISTVKSKGSGERVSRVLDLVGLSREAEKFPRQLSGGMRQRVSLARALAPEPNILLLDEPFASIDLLTRERIMIELHRILRNAGTPTILVTHNVEEALFLSDRLLLLVDRPATVAQVWYTNMGFDRGATLLETPEFGEMTFQVKKKLRSIPSSPT